MPLPFEVGTWDRVAQRAARYLFRKPATLAPGQSLVSFTFDDFPKSALSCAGGILTENGMSGTYYASFKLAGTADRSGAYFDMQDVDDLLRAGHELGCHTYSHNNFMLHRPAQIHREFERNAEACRDAAHGTAMSDFAYPYGRVSPSLKLIAGRRFASARSTRQGINTGTIDLNELRGWALVRNTQPSEIAAVIRRNESVGGWLIFFTHDVSDAPTDYGCRRDAFEAAVRLAAGSRSRVVTVREGVALLSR
jgi:peptidoglycan/xylan/chitin deacetylase (PgdA/CDA1 family)